MKYEQQSSIASMIDLDCKYNVSESLNESTNLNFQLLRVSIDLCIEV